MARKFGTGSASRVGATGKIDESETNSDKWAGSVAAQIATSTQVKELLTKTIPVDYVYCDPENPRKLAISQQDLINIAKKHPIDKACLAVDNSTDWIEDYVNEVGQSEQLDGKALGDFESLVNFASALKSSDRLLHPIVVWREESTFHLIAGERRLLTHILLGEKFIAARILDQRYDRAQIDTLQWEENVQRVDMTLWERVDHVRKLLEAGEGTQKTSVTKLSKILGRSRAESQRYLAVLRYSDPIIMTAIEQGRVNDLKTAAAFAQLSLDEIQQKLGQTPKDIKVKAPIKITDKTAIKGMAKIIRAAAAQLKLSDSIDEFNLHKSKELTQALSVLLAEVEHESNH